MADSIFAVVLGCVLLVLCTRRRRFEWLFADVLREQDEFYDALSAKIKVARHQKLTMRQRLVLTRVALGGTGLVAFTQGLIGLIRKI